MLLLLDFALFVLCDLLVLFVLDLCCFVLIYGCFGFNLGMLFVRLCYFNSVVVCTLLLFCFYLFDICVYVLKFVCFVCGRCEFGVRLMIIVVLGLLFDSCFMIWV